MKINGSELQLKKYFLSTLAMVVLFLIVYPTVPVSAAEVFFGADSTTVSVDDELTVDVFLNTEDEDINAVAGRILISEIFWQLKEIKDGDSIINFWAERPQFVRGEISFSGVIPGGYSGQKGLIFSAVFRARQAGESIMAIQNAQALLNDGQGTETKTTPYNLQLIISEPALSPAVTGEIATASPPSVKEQDKTMPEEFVPTVAVDTDMFDGQYFLVFAAQDKESGIDHYEIQENRRQKIKIKQWVNGVSPYLLTDQKLSSYVYVKAVDKSGNSRITMLSPQNPRSEYRNYLIFGILIIIGFMLAAFSRRKKL
ncbi:MAG: hypothetical protein UV95_C0005G0014 [Candidatus Falkowbacteria bacterium GW2011_GWF2_43_32]|nr:MAG: hypothetical protein UV95_C0005G0014 [Candidatus Falkowbacteria bacterium GW2011_GWF2_43_32]